MGFNVSKRSTTSDGRVSLEMAEVDPLREGGGCSGDPRPAAPFTPPTLKAMVTSGNNRETK
jgi:hypothetical protein